MIQQFLTKITNTLRGRLTLWYLLSLGLIIGLILVSLTSLFWFAIKDQIDHHLHIAVNEARQIVQNYHGGERDALIKNLVSAQGMTVIVLSPDGTPILETNSPDVALVTEHQLQKILTSTSLYQSIPIHFTESQIRFAAIPVQVSAGKGIVAVGYSTQILYATFYRMLLIVAGVIILLVLPVTFIGYRFLTKQLQPLERIANQAKSVSDLSSLAKRISISSPTQELTTIQQALNSMLAQLEQVFKSEREFFSDAAHTLKTPLAVLRSQIENSQLSSKSRAELLSTIDTANDTIGDLLFLAKIGHQSPHLTTVSLTDIIIDLAELAATLGEDKHLKVSADVQKDVSLQADKKQLQRALSNLVYNAVAYNKRHGTINLSLKQTGNHTTIIIKDTGIGIKKTDQPHLFTRFFRGANMPTRGTGLGLAIAKAVVESLGGHIAIQSSLNQGTTVSIAF